MDACRRGIILYLEYQSVCPPVRIGSANPRFRKLVCLPRNGGGGQHSPAGEGMGGHNSDDWRESLALCLLWDDCYFMVLVRCIEKNALCRNKSAIFQKCFCYSIKISFIFLFSFRYVRHKHHPFTGDGCTHL
jgi:hypothetical protein